VYQETWTEDRGTLAGRQSETACHSWAAIAMTNTCRHYVKSYLDWLKHKTAKPLLELEIENS